MSEKQLIDSDGHLTNNMAYMAYAEDKTSVCLDGYFSLDELKAIVKYMETKTPAQGVE